MEQKSYFAADMHLIFGKQLSLDTLNIVVNVNVGMIN